MKKIDPREENKIFYRFQDVCLSLVVSYFIYPTRKLLSAAAMPRYTIVCNEVCLNVGDLLKEERGDRGAGRSMSNF